MVSRFTTKHMWRFIRPSELPRSRAAKVIDDFNRIKLLPLIAHFVHFPTDAAAANRSEPLISKYSPVRLSPPIRCAHILSQVM